MSEKLLLETAAALSHEFGGPDYVKGGGGNSSAKTVDTLWVKPSGTTLAGLAPGTFVTMDRRGLADLYSLEIPADSSAREALVKEGMARAVKPGQTARPSVEAPLHDLLSPTYVIHTHMVLVNGLTCGRKGAAACARLFPESLWVPYIDPGFTLCLDVRKRVGEYAAKHGRQPAVIILENHGIFVAADTPEAIRAAYAQVTSIMTGEYRKAGVPTALPRGPAPAAEVVATVTARLRELLGEDAKCVLAEPSAAVAKGPLSPDHIVYAKAYPYRGALSAEGVADFRARHGYNPKVFALPEGLFTAAPSEKQARLALDLALDGAIVAQLTKAFGGPQFLGDAAREFIENWEVESYRQKQMA